MFFAGDDVPRLRYRVLVGGEGRHQAQVYEQEPPGTVHDPLLTLLNARWLALEAVPRGELVRVVVVSQYAEIEALAAEYGFLAVHNGDPGAGLSHTVALGLAALADCDAVLFQVADQPLLRRESVGRLIALWREHPEKIAAVSGGGRRGNPCLFPARFFPELLALTGDCGGSRVIRQHEDELMLLEVDARELADVDTPQALAEVEREMRQI